MTRRLTTPVVRAYASIRRGRTGSCAPGCPRICASPRTADDSYGGGSIPGREAADSEHVIHHASTPLANGPAVRGCPVPLHTAQTAAVQVCAFPVQVQSGAGTRPPPHASHCSSLFMAAPVGVASHLVTFTRSAPITARSGSRQGLVPKGLPRCFGHAKARRPRGCTPLDGALVPGRGARSAPP